MACPVGRDDQCRMMARLRAGGAVVDVANYLAAPAVEWRWREAPEPDVHIGVYGGEQGDECSCLLSSVRAELLRLMAAMENDPDDGQWAVQDGRAAGVVAAIVLDVALALGASRRAVIEVSAPARPQWFPAPSPHPAPL